MFLEQATPLQRLTAKEEPGKFTIIVPLESRKSRHVGIAHVLLPSVAEARELANQIDGSVFPAPADATVLEGAAKVCAVVLQEEKDGTVSEPVRWKGSDAFFKLHLYHEHQSVEDGDKPDGASVELQRKHTGKTGSGDVDFQEAARRERQEQARARQAQLFCAEL